MDVAACIEAYTGILNSIYEKKSSVFKFGRKKEAPTQEVFDSQILVKAISKILKSRKISESTVFGQGTSGCRA